MPYKNKWNSEVIGSSEKFKLAWKSIDVQPESEADFFSEGSIKLQEGKQALLNRMFALMNKKWKKYPQAQTKIERIPKKKHVWVSGGNVTYYSSLAELVRKLQWQRPLLPIRALLVEGNFNELIKSRIDFGFYAESSASEEKGLTKDFQPGNLRREADNYYREYFEDTAYFYCGKDLIKEHGSIEKVKEKAPVIFGRPATPFEVGVKEEFYEIFPGKMREPTLVADQIILNHFLMINSVAIWIMWDSWKDDRSGLVKMEKVFTFKRILARKKRYGRVKMGKRIMR